MIKCWLFAGSILLLVLAGQARAQVVDEPLEIETPADTAEFYKKLYNYSRERKSLFFLYKAIFNPPVQKAKRKKSRKKTAGLPTQKFKNKIIRNINIVSLEPFGTDLNDTSKKPHSLLQKGGNTLHIKSKQSTIRNFLIFKPHTKADPLKIAESERLLRQSGYIRDAKIIVKAIPGNRDSVDVDVWTQDYWSIRPNLTLTTSRTRYRLTENNVAGFGHEFDFRVTDLLNESSPLIIDASYQVPSIGNTYISPKLFIGTSDENNIRGISINRGFYSPLTKHAGGVDFLSRSDADSTQLESDTIYHQFKYRSFVTDGWVAKSWNLLKGETNEERSTKFITALRYGRIRYPVLSTDAEVKKYYFKPVDLFLGSISLSSRKYVKDRYIFKFGEAEDVPDGRKLTLTSGYEMRGDLNRWYFSVEGAVGTYFPSLGYLYIGTGYGTYFGDKAMSQGLVSASMIHLSPLKQFGKWWLRQFTSVDFDYGINRNFDEKLSLNADKGLPGYKNVLPQGTSRLVISTQSVLYSPIEFLGFRFAPILVAGIAMTGDYNSSVLKSRLYQSYGLGLLVKNELLVLNTFQVILAIYPVLPESGAEFRFNPVKLRESRFYDFEITRPQIAVFY